MLKLFKNVFFLGFLVISLAISTLTLGFHAANLTAKVAVLTSASTVAAVKHRKEIAKVLAKARLKRFIVAIPILGSGAAVAFEASEFKDWQAANPQKSEVDYLCENASLSIEVFDEVTRDLPESLRVSTQSIIDNIENCSLSN